MTAEPLRCESCDGTGRAAPDCHTCAGAGWVDDPEDGGTMTCPQCDDEMCDVCGGSGHVSE